MSLLEWFLMAMSGKTVGIAAVIVLIVIGAAFFALRGLTGGAPSVTTSTVYGQNFTHNSTQSSGMLFNDTQYAQSAYLISGNANLSAAGENATSNVVITSNALQNGSIEYVLAFAGSNAAYNVTITPGEQLYFIGTNLSENSTTGNSYGDYGYAVVNASTGYTVSIEYPLQHS